MAKYKLKFKDEDWKTLQFAVFWVFREIAAADGEIDKRELSAFSYLTKVFNNLRSELARELIGNISSQGLRKLSSECNHDMRSTYHGLDDVVNILDDNIEPEIALEFKKALIAIGIFIAYSSNFLYAPKICEDEENSLKTVTSILRVSKEELHKSPTIQDYIENLKGEV